MKQKNMYNLIELLNGLNYKVLQGDINIKIDGLAYNSKEVKTNYIFFALKGQKTHGKNYINEAISNGVKVIISEEELYLPTENITVIKADDILGTMSRISSKFYDNPSSKLLVIGVTGTNGKTTVTYLLNSIFSAAGFLTSLIGTIQYKIGDKVSRASLTTPQAPDIHQLLYESQKAQVKVVIMEVSSHSLALKRVDDVKFDIACFTNLSREHLDFHGDMENYFMAKAKLFINLNEGKYAIINNDSEYGKRLKNMTKANILTYGLSKDANFYAENIKMNHKNISFEIVHENTRIPISLSLIGIHNVYNSLAAYAVAVTQNIPVETIKSGLENLKHVPGRLEKLDLGQPFTVVIDYAHTDDALKNILLTLQQLKPKRLILVFGCGGERDRSKRPLMGEIGVTLSDYVILTNDNPRNEDPERILLDIEVGINRTGKNNYEIIQDRSQAIKRAIEMAQEGDIVLIAGKGHEEYQIIGNTRVTFSDKEVASEYIKLYYGKNNNKRNNKRN